MEVLMISKWSKSFLTAFSAAITVTTSLPTYAGLPISANTIEPIPFAGTPTAADIRTVCGLPTVSNPIVPSGIVEVRVATLAPVNTTGVYFVDTSDGYRYQVNVTVLQKNPTIFKYEDVSAVPGFATGIVFPPDLSGLGLMPPGDQFHGTRGTEAVSVTSGSATNIYCGDGVIRDTNLGPPANNASQISFWWVAGPCGLNSSNVSSVCSIYGSTSALPLIITATQDKVSGAWNSGGCQQTLQLCNSKLLNVPQADNNIVACNFQGDNGPSGFQSEAILFGHSPLCRTLAGKTYC